MAPDPTVATAFADLQITLERGQRRTILTGQELAQMLGGPGTTVRLVAILHAKTSTAHPQPLPLTEKKRGGGDDETGLQELTERNGSEKLSERRFVGLESRSSLAAAPRPFGQESLDATMRIASNLADRLHDAKSLRFYRLVAQLVPPDVIQDALLAALDLPQAEIRRTRAAYFTSLVTPHMRAGRKK